ncbi:MAG: sugar ABC transporter ATP-binding protein [Spirochaetales bacterium]|nr:sugar ABC transporter ATP-binding protein [Spirochaetales bacterium]
MVVLEAKGIKKHFGGVVALADANLICRKGKITGLLGANGSGKSTMSKIISGVYSADGGDIRFKGEQVKYRNPNEAQKNGIAMVFQNLSLVPDLTVWQNIVLGAEEKKRLFLNNEASRIISRNIIDKLLPGLDINRMIYELNPGEMQIVEIAKAVSAKPELLILDEPTAALEQAEVKSLFTYMRSLVEQGVSIIFTSHRLWEVMEICDDIVVFRNGTNAGHIDFETEEKDPEKLIRYITGGIKEIKIEKDRNTLSGNPVLQVHHLSYGGILKDISFELRKGEILGIGGLAGQGQHELMLLLAGNYPKAVCCAELNGKPINLTKPVNAIRNNILLVPGDRQLEGLFLNHPVFTNLIFPKMGLKKQPFITPRKMYKEECERTIARLSIKTDGLDIPVRTLSGGNQQKIVVGKWLPFDVNVLLLADPAKGVDIGAKQDLYAYIIEQVKKERMSVILYASDNQELIEYCDRVLIMYEGRIVSTIEENDINEDRIISASMGIGRTEGERHE